MYDYTRGGRGQSGFVDGTVLELMASAGSPIQKKATHTSLTPSTFVGSPQGLFKSSIQGLHL